SSFFADHNSFESSPSDRGSERILQLRDSSSLKPATRFQQLSEISSPNNEGPYGMILVKLGNQAISGHADKNQFPKLDGLSQKYLVANMQNVYFACHRGCSASNVSL